MSTKNYLHIRALRAEVEDWKDNYNKATDACVALRAENARLRERLRFDDEEPYAHIDSLQSEVRDWQENYKRAMDGRVALRAENAKLREALEKIAKPDPRYVFDVYDLAGIARAALQKDEGE